jgi:hypothetical protein
MATSPFFSRKPVQAMTRKPVFFDGVFLGSLVRGACPAVRETSVHLSARYARISIQDGYTYGYDGQCIICTAFGHGLLQCVYNTCFGHCPWQSKSTLLVQSAHCSRRRRLTPALSTVWPTIAQQGSTNITGSRRIPSLPTPQLAQVAFCTPVARHAVYQTLGHE